MTHNTPIKLRAVRCVASGKVTSQSSNKTKRLLKLGGYVEVSAGSVERVLLPARSTGFPWRTIGIGAAMILSVSAVLVWLRLVNFI